MKKVVAILFLLNLSLFAYKYNEFLIKTQAALLPKIMLLDKKFANKTVDSKVKIAIIFNENDINTAFLLKTFITNYYGSDFENYMLVIKLKKVEDFLNSKEKYSAIYLLKLSEDNYQKIYKKIKNSNIYSFVYDKDDLKYGFLFSIDLEEKPIIFMNKKAINKNFDFIEQLYTLVRLIDNV
ncbi:hypothetical protein [Nitrosophilus kaiyonis]|uniref:hypothetical protein n=1 Tax=Nitrosophilus kaiyonis TaxID=2930200 RepID=UPI00248FD77C|nr:hypothetical protein [Nitrosophilus kaiyonis]